jgi:predicted alpha/beta superfamily hydrolase
MRNLLLLTIPFWIFTTIGCTDPKNQVEVKANAIPPVFSIGVIDSLYSQELGEIRHLNVYLPENYSPDSATAYPVIYLLDGSANEDFVHVVGVVQFLTMIGSMLPSIVVGIANVDRKRDFTFPTHVQEDLMDFPTTGHSDKFIAFLEKELITHVTSHYKTNGQRLIIGQSLGGLLACEVLLKKNTLFTDYVIVSPSLWWDNESLLNEAPQLLSVASFNKQWVFLTVGTEGEEMEVPAKKIGEMLKDSTDNQLNVVFHPLPQEDHLTILHNAVYTALMEKYKEDKPIK